MQENNDSITFNNPLIQFVSEKRFRWLRHSLFIIMCLLLGFKGDLEHFNDTHPSAVQNAFLKIDACTTVFIMSMIYLLLLVLIPKLLFRSKVFLFSICFFIQVSLIYLVVWYVDYYFLMPLDETGTRFQHVELSFLAYIQYCGIGSVLLGSVVGMSIFKKWINDTHRMNALQQANMKAELNQLKSQVNPHFLFNTLNNLVVLTKTDPEKATQVLLGLSDLLRYQLYDMQHESINLSKDINFINNFLSLEKIRKTDFDYSVTTTGNTKQVTLPPFLFIPFIENAVKHGASTVGHSYLNTSFTVTDDTLHFFAENSKPAIQKKTIGGLGLSNIKRRLQLLYPGTHELNIKEDSDKYIVNLTIPL